MFGLASYLDNEDTRLAVHGPTSLQQLAASETSGKDVAKASAAILRRFERLGLATNCEIYVDGTPSAESIVFVDGTPPVVHLARLSPILLLHEFGHIFDFNSGKRAFYHMPRNDTGETTDAELLVEQGATRFALQTTDLSERQVAATLSMFSTYLIRHPRTLSGVCYSTAIEPIEDNHADGRDALKYGFSRLSSSECSVVMRFIDFIFKDMAARFGSKSAGMYFDRAVDVMRSGGIVG